MQDDDGRLVAAIARSLYDTATGAERPCFGREPASVKRHYFNLARSALAAIEREGWKVVRAKPTEAMVRAAILGDEGARSEFHEMWTAALSASPKQG